VLAHVAGDKFAGLTLGPGGAVDVDQVEQQLLQTLRIKPLTRRDVPFLLLG
jgi:hypothetical protein